MTGVFHFRGPLLGLAALVAQFAAAPLAHAAPVAPDRNATATVNIVPPSSVRKLEDLDFAYLSVTTAGSATINPDTEAMTTSGGVLHVTGVPQAAEFEAVSPVRTVIIIRVPRDPITLTRVGGTETMTVSNWTMSGNARRTVAAFEAVPFKVGGRLNVNANQVEGTYVGTFDVEVQYP